MVLLHQCDWQFNGVSPMNVPFWVIWIAPIIVSIVYILRIVNTVWNENQQDACHIKSSIFMQKIDESIDNLMWTHKYD